MRKIIGPDVSFYQDSPSTPQGIDFVRMNEVTDFVIVRAGQHLGADSDFRQNWTNSKAAGLPRGSYWFYDSRADPRQQAELWFRLLGGDLGELPLFADLEEAYGGPFTGWTHWRTFLDRFKTLVGNKEVGIYTGYYYWKSNAPTSTADLEYFHRYPLWIANYSATQPLVPRPWGTNEWLFWQYTASGNGLFYGVESLEIDLNYFNGDAQAFADRFHVPIPPDPVPPEDPTGKRYRVNANTLFVRQGPGTNFPAIGYFVRNDIVEALEANEDGSWYRVRRLSDGLTGWSSALYLVKIPTPPPPSGTDQYRVTASTLNVREGPGTNYRAIGFFVRDDIVEFVEANSDRSWLRVRRLTDGLTGWCSARFLLKLSPPPPGGGEEYRVNADTLYVREGPATTYRAIGFLERDDIVERLDANSDGTWLRIRRLTDGLTGWSSARYLVKVAIEVASTEQEPVMYYRVTATRLHVREGPGTQYTSLGYAELNEVVVQLDVNPDQTWRQIQRSDGLTGWSSARYLVPYDMAPPPGPGEPPHIYTGDWYEVTSASLQMREGPETSFASKGSLSKGESVQALEISEDQAWLHFRRVNGLTAWSSLSYLKNLGKTPAVVMQKMFPGVKYYRNEQTSPRTVVSHVLEIDTRSPGLRFLVTPPMRDTFPQLCTQTTSQFLARQGLQMAINGDGFYYLDPMEYDPQAYCSERCDPIRLIGYAASRGKVYSEGARHPILYINRQNVISFDKPTGKIYNAISGDQLLVQKGKKVSGLDNISLHPRTAFGVNQNGRWVYMVVVDGRETSSGVTFDELADILVSYGVYTGISFDGGGSSTMVVEGADGRPQVVNTVVDANTPGRERAVGNHLGVALKR